MLRSPPFVGVAGPCDLDCAWCNPARERPVVLPGEAARVGARLAALAAAGHRDVGLGVHHAEPTTHPELPEVVARARALGFRRVVLSTSGMAVSERPYLRELVAAGLTEVVLTVVGADRGGSEVLLGRAEASERKLVAVEAAAAEGLETHVALLLLRPALHGLAEAAREVHSRLRALRSSSLHAQVLDPVPDLDRARAEALWPRLDELLWAVLRLREVLPELEVQGTGLAPCLSGRLAPARSTSPGPSAAPVARVRLDGPCGGCPEPGCPGLELAEAERLAGAGPVRALEPREPPRPELGALRRALRAGGEPAEPAWKARLLGAIAAALSDGRTLAGFRLAELRAAPGAVLVGLERGDERLALALEPREGASRWFVAGDRLAASYRSAGPADTADKDRALRALHALAERCL